MAGLPITFLSGIINRQPDSNFGTGAVSNGSYAVDADSKALMSLLDSLSNGETIVGRIMSQKDGMLRILTSDNITINAKVGDNVSLTEGTQALFEVNKSTDGQIALRPLYQNLASEETASAALRQAGLPVNDRSLEMVARNMEYGNPIDRNSLIKAYRDVALFPETPVKYIADLQKMGIQVTKPNLEQYGAYLNMENSVSEAFSDIGDSIADEITLKLSEFESGQITDQPEVDNTDASSVGKAPLTVMTDTSDVSIPVKDMPVSDRGISSFLDPLSDFAETMQDTKAPDVAFSKEEVADLAESFKSFNNGENIKELLNESPESVSPKEVLKAVIKDMKASFEARAVQGEVPKLEEGSDEIPAKPVITPQLKNVIVRAFSSQWALDKEALSQKGEVRELYSRLFEQTGRLLSSLTEIAGKDSAVTAKVQNLSDNLQFMNSLNSFVPYVQIPFRTDNGNAGSELYVYKNKKNLSSGESELSAFIHLDMESLGPTDVYVKMKDSNVSTRFTLADDSALDLINDNIELLNKRLSEKGYSLNAEMTVDKQEPPISQMLSNTTDRLYVSKTSFDARI